MTFWLWLGFLALLGALVALDLGFLSRRARRITPLEAALTTALWALGALALALALAEAYRAGWLGPAGVAPEPAQVALEFITAYAVELSLSLDNIAVLALVLAYFNYTPANQERLLLWLTVLNLLGRAVLIEGAGRVLHLGWVKWAFAGLLVIAMFRTLLMPGERAVLDHRRIIRVARSIVPPSVWPGPGGAGAPMWVALLVAATADLSFGLDSVPAVLAITRDPIVAFMSNAMAVLAMRSIYFWLAPIVLRLRFVRLGITVVLFALIPRTLVASPGEWSTAGMLALVVVVMGGSLAASWWRARATPAPAPVPTPLEDMAEAVALTRRNLRKVLVLIAGTVVLLIAVIISPLPGPGFMIIAPLGLALLATEFLWARRLLDQLRQQTSQLKARADTVASRFPRWTAPLAAAAYAAAFWGAITLAPPALRTPVYAGFIGGMFPLAYFVYSVLIRARPQAPPPP